MNYKLKIRNLQLEFIELMTEWYNEILEKTDGKGYRDFIRITGDIRRTYGNEELRWFWNHGFCSNQWKPSKRLVELRIILNEFDKLFTKRIRIYIRSLFDDEKEVNYIKDEDM
jgi:hypothetical protein